MTLLTQELLKKKLSSWVMSSKTPEILGFDESKSNEIKHELAALVEMGLVEKTGERRGLKYRWVNPTNLVGSDKNKDKDPLEKPKKDVKIIKSNFDEEDSDVTEDEDIEVEVLSRKHDESAKLRTFFANRDSIKSETEGNKTPIQLLSVLLDTPIKDPSVLSHTLSFKKTTEGNVIMTFWMGCVQMYQKEMSLTAFNKLLTAELKTLSKSSTTV